MNQPLLILALLAALACCQAAPAQESREATAVQSTPGFSQLSVSGEHGVLLVSRGPDGAITAIRDGAVVPPERVRREGDHLRILDEAGTVLWELRLLPDGGLVYPYDAKVDGRWREATAFGAWYGESTPRKVIGVMVDAVDSALASQLDIEPDAAFLISGVTEGMPAEKAGLAAHDVVVSIQGAGPATVDRLREVLDDKQPGDTIQIGVLRRGERLDLEVGVAEAQEPQLRSISELMERRQAEMEEARDRLADLEAELADAKAALDEARQEAAAGDESARDEVTRRRAEVEALQAELMLQQSRLESGTYSLQFLDMSGGGRALMLPQDASLYGAYAATPLSEDVDDRLKAMEERLARLEELLEKLVESDAAK